MRPEATGKVTAVFRANRASVGSVDQAGVAYFGDATVDSRSIRQCTVGLRDFSACNLLCVQGKVSGRRGAAIDRMFRRFRLQVQVTSSVYRPSERGVWLWLVGLGHKCHS